MVTTQQPTVAPAVVFGDVPVTVTDSAGNQVRPLSPSICAHTRFYLSLTRFFLDYIEHIVLGCGSVNN